MKKKKLSERQQQMMRSVLSKEGMPGQLIEGDIICHRGKDYDVRSDDRTI